MASVVNSNGLKHTCLQFRIPARDLSTSTQPPLKHAQPSLDIPLRFFIKVTIDCVKLTTETNHQTAQASDSQNPHKGVKTGLIPQGCPHVPWHITHIIHTHNTNSF